MTRAFGNLSPSPERTGRACAWVEREDGYVLMAGLEWGGWTLPGGGIDRGESAAEAAEVRLIDRGRERVDVVVAVGLGLPDGPAAGEHGIRRRHQRGLVRHQVGRGEAEGRQLVHAVVDHGRGGRREVTGDRPHHRRVEPHQRPDRPGQGGQERTPKKSSVTPVDLSPGGTGRTTPAPEKPRAGGEDTPRRTTDDPDTDTQSTGSTR